MQASLKRCRQSRKQTLDRSLPTRRCAGPGRCRARCSSWRACCGERGSSRRYGASVPDPRYCVPHGSCCRASMPPTPRHHGFSPSHPHLHSALPYLLSPSRVIAIHPSPLLILLIFRPPSASSILAPRIPPSSPDPPPHHPFPDSRDRPLSRLPVSTPSSPEQHSLLLPAAPLYPASERAR